MARLPGRPRLAPGAVRYALPLFGLAAVSLAVSRVASAALALLGGGVLWFFRDPDRDPPEAGVLAPADGRVSVLRAEGDRVRVGVFMSPLDVHVTRAPVAGTVSRVAHRGAAHRPAFSKDSDRNERVEFALDGAVPVEGALVAGWFARRISPYVSPGDRVARGERLGHIAFGSRADVVLPEEVGLDDVRVSRGERVRAGESVLAVVDGAESAGSD